MGDGWVWEEDYWVCVWRIVGNGVFEQTGWAGLFLGYICGFWFVRVIDAPCSGIHYLVFPLVRHKGSLG